MAFTHVLPHELPDRLQGDSAYALSEGDEQALIGLLDRHYGDGSLYLVQESAPQCLKLARNLGLVSAQGYLTPRGYQFWRRRSPE